MKRLAAAAAVVVEEKKKEQLHQRRGQEDLWGKLQKADAMKRPETEKEKGEKKGGETETAGEEKDEELEHNPTS